MTRTQEDQDQDDIDNAEMYELMDMPDGKRQRVVQQLFNKADADFRKWQMTADAFTVETDKMAPAIGRHYLKHRTTDKVVGWTEGSKTRCKLVTDGDCAIHFKSEESARKFLAEVLSEGRINF